MRDLVIIGAGDVGKFVAYHFSNLSEYRLLGFLDDDKNKLGKSIANYPVLGDWTYLKRKKNISVILGIADPLSKLKIWNNLKEITGIEFPNLIHPECWLGGNATFGIGNIVYPGVTINYDTKVKNFITINMNCAIGHNCILNDFVSLSPGVNLGGFTEIGENSFIGIGSNTIQSIKIGTQCTIGGGSMIIKNIPSGSTVVGNPGRIVKGVDI